MHGVDLKQDLPGSTINKIKEAVTKYADISFYPNKLRSASKTPLSLCRHRVLVFREQGVISGQRQVDVSQWFGPCESTFFKHPKSPHPDIFRVSNSDLEGCTGQHCGLFVLVKHLQNQVQPLALALLSLSGKWPSCSTGGCKSKFDAPTHVQLLLRCTAHVCRLYIYTVHVVS